MIFSKNTLCSIVSVTFNHIRSKQTSVTKIPTISLQQDAFRSTVVYISKIMCG
jgi:hypothetical protein